MLTFNLFLRLLSLTENVAALFIPIEGNDGLSGPSVSFVSLFCSPPSSSSLFVCSIGRSDEEDEEYEEEEEEDEEVS